jgi:hypothetical protein
MTEATPEPVPAETPAQEPKPAAEEPQPKVDEIDWKAKAREWEKRAKENKSAAEKLAEIEEANKSEVQKASDRLAAAERERDQARVEGLRFKVAVKHGISEEDAELFLTGSDEEALTRQAQRLTAREAEREAALQAAEAERKKRGNHVPREGTTSTSTEGDERETARLLFGG